MIFNKYKNQQSKVKNGISIIITAYKAQDYIEETLDSLQAQTWLQSHDNYEILLGTDHCEDTLKKVRNIVNKYQNITVIYMKENYGTYITSNTLISLAKYNWILRFDADDIMKPNMIESIFDFLEVKPNTDILRFYYKSFSDNIKDLSKRATIAHGIICAAKSMFKKYGCYMPWICGADTELLTRLKNEVKIEEIIKVTFLRRKHEESLTQSPETNSHSKIRAKYREYIKSASLTTPIIETVTGDYSMIDFTKPTIYYEPEELEEPEELKKVKRIKAVSKKIYLRTPHAYNGI